MLEGARILVVEDDAAINRIVCSYLGKMGAMCTAAFSGTEGLMHLAGGEDFHLVITDLMLPGASGEEVLAAARAAAVPVVVLSARAAVADRVDLLRLGADDYLVKPFDLEELLARCEAVLRRSAGPGRAGDIRGAGAGQEADVAPLRFGAWELDETARAFTAAGMSVRLTRTEFEIVRTLMAAPRRVHTKRALSIAAGGDAAALEDKTVATHIGNIRAKLRATGTDDYVETVWGVGFKLREL
ncbi:response regulator transcription factor [Adlercreutzia muris]|uniref:response regulator transcription factor n=1 Tax=Adlercreutzia muris TaxID=1796610 RepID=UPI001F57EDB3|nr:response regulator transcription factor [Adlercreutzia muris]